MHHVALSSCSVSVEVSVFACDTSVTMDSGSNSKLRQCLQHAPFRSSNVTTIKGTTPALKSPHLKLTPRLANSEKGSEISRHSSYLIAAGLIKGGRAGKWRPGRGWRTGKGREARLESAIASGLRISDRFL